MIIEINDTFLIIGIAMALVGVSWVIAFSYGKLFGKAEAKQKW